MLTNLIDVRAWVEAAREERRDEARSAIASLLAWVEGEAQGLPLVAVERELLVRLIALGCTLVALWLVLRMPEQVPQHLRDGRGWYTYRGILGETVRTQFGEVWSPRAAYELVSGKGARMVAPLDRAIGLAAGRMSLGVHLLVGNLAARMPFDEVGEILAQIGLYRPSKKSMLGIVDQLGPSARKFLYDMPAPAGDGEILVIQIDEKGAPGMSYWDAALKAEKRYYVHGDVRDDGSYYCSRCDAFVTVDHIDAHLRCPFREFIMTRRPRDNARGDAIGDTQAVMRLDERINTVADVRNYMTSRGASQVARVKMRGVFSEYARTSREARAEVEDLNRRFGRVDA